MIVRRLVSSLPLIAAVMAAAVYTTACCCCPIPGGGTISTLREAPPEIAPDLQARTTATQAH